MFQRPTAASWWWDTAALVALALLAALVFRPGLHGPFLYDDFPNFLFNGTVTAYVDHAAGLGAVLADASAGPLGRPLSVASLALQMALSGPDPFPFKLFNLAVHLVNAGLLYALARQLFRAHGPLRARAGALLAAAAWAVHPLVLSPVLYVVQRMASLSALGMLVALNAAVAGHQRLADGRTAWPWLWLAVPLGGVVGLLAKENGALLPFLLAVLATTVLAPASALPPPARSAWRRFLAVMVWLPLVLAAVALALAYPHILLGYADRPFTFREHLLTELRVIWLYLRLAVLPDLGALGLYHDDVPLSTGWLEPWTTLPAAAGLLALAASAVVQHRRWPWFSFAVGIFLASQLLESSIIALEVMHEHRVYLAVAGLPVALVALLLDQLSRQTPGARRLGWLAGAAVVLLLAVVCAQRAHDWGNPLAMAQLEALHHPGSVRAQYDLGAVYDKLAERSSGSERARLFGLAELSVRRAGAVAPEDSKPMAGLLLLCSQTRCAVPPQTWTRLQERLRSGPRADLMISDVTILSQCRRDRVCRLPLQPILDCFDALLANPGLTARGRATLLDERTELRRSPGQEDS